jgi:hypothetical protein
LSEVARVPSSSVSSRGSGKFSGSEDRLISELTVSSHDPSSVRRNTVDDDEHENGSRNEDSGVGRKLGDMENSRSIRVGGESRVTIDSNAT